MTTQNNQSVFTLPPGRLVWGDPYKARTTDKDGKPYIVKTGANAGQPGKQWAFGVAIAKQGEANWWETPWGQKFLAIAQAGFPGGEWQRPDFAWKITDGDSAIPKKGGAAPNTIAHNKGHWIVSCSTFASAPPTFMKNPQSGQFEQIVGQDGFIKCGYFVEVNIDVKANTGQSPGVYVGPRMLAFVGYGPEIFQGPDVSQAGFGQSPMPSGASAAPVGGFNPAAPAPGIPPGMPAAMPGMMASPAAMMSAPGMVPGAPQLPAAQMMPAPAAMMPAPGIMAGAPQPLALAPHTAILGMQGQPAPTPMPMGVPATGVPVAHPMPGPSRAPQRVMTAKANGATYEQFIAMGGWDDNLLVQHGMMVIQ